MTRAWLSLGSNVEPEQNLRAALRELRARFGDLTISPLYRFPAVGFDGPDFLNLAVGLDTDLSAGLLDDWLHALEDRHGRRRDVPRFSSRTLDVDIVLYDELVLKGAGSLEIPRRELLQSFVLQPLVQIAGDTCHPTLRRTLASLWSDRSAAGSLGALVHL